MSLYATIISMREYGFSRADVAAMCCCRPEYVRVCEQRAKRKATIGTMASPEERRKDTDRKRRAYAEGRHWQQRNRQRVRETSRAYYQRRQARIKAQQQGASP